MTRIAIFAATMLIAGLTLGGCSDGAGQASSPDPTSPPPATSVPQIGGTAAPPTTMTHPQRDARFSKVDACALLSSAELASLGLGAGQPTNRASTRYAVSGCEWQQPGRGGTDVVVYDQAITGPGVETPIGKVGRYDAIRRADDVGVCGVELIPSPYSRVVISVVSSREAEKNCDRALAMAQTVEPKLP
ncbi:uncharacterized protein DUF3558 [Herbihabitans rhizosphaerae]|uniref:Uncharacterized protein DUF3558 n=1 Tax=Herbihabitans rhizosphaerae TaxID=1872711 RepID=A0A4Q7KWX9_9PSEU|nr:DUF3558 family protein [Herbihabitans rhizosphaerae]RZS41294.1 uncharacterized protein DUF3558 [Herbihabitans rhizosphaerae]